MSIARDIGAPFDPTDPLQVQEFEEFMCPPDTAVIVADLLDPLAVNSRAHRLLDPAAIVPRIDPLALDVLPTPDPVAPQVTFERQGMNRDQNFNIPGVGTTEIWSFNNGDGNFVWPGPTIRIREGQVAHTLMTNSRGEHTVHNHGIEPTAANDGVGHLTFDVNGAYTYQWLAAKAGTHFYHCHVNTVLHFEMGMYGMLIVDPDVDGAPFADGGPGVTWVGNTLTPYNAEAIWVADDIERRWHTNPEHGTGDPATGVLCGGAFIGINDPGNPHLHDFDPDVFVISGIPPEVRGTSGARQNVAGAGATVVRGQRLLIRAVNASYTTTRWRFPTALQGQVIAADGRTLGREPFGRYSSPFTLASIGHQFTFTTAQRWDLLIDTTGATPGQHVVEIDFHQWITDEIFDFGRLSVPIIVT